MVRLVQVDALIASRSWRELFQQNGTCEECELKGYTPYRDEPVIAPMLQYEELRGVGHSYREIETKMSQSGILDGEYDISLERTLVDELDISQERARELLQKFGSVERVCELWPIMNAETDDDMPDLEDDVDTSQTLHGDRIETCA